LYYLLNRFKKAARQNFAVFFFAQRGVTALVGTGGVAELEVSGLRGSLYEPLGEEVVLTNPEVTRVSGFALANPEIAKEVSGTQPGQDVGHGPRGKQSSLITMVLGKPGSRMRGKK